MNQGEDSHESNDGNFPIPSSNTADEEINSLIKERKIYSSNNKEKSFRSLPLKSTRDIQSLPGKMLHHFNEAINNFWQLLEKMLNFISVPRKLAFASILSLSLYSLCKYRDVSEYASNPYHGKVGMYYKPETFSSQSITSTSGDMIDNENQEDFQGIEESLLRKESSIPIPPSLSNVADVSHLPLNEQDIPFYFHIPRAGGSTIKDILGSCLGLVGASHVGLYGKSDIANATKIEIVTARHGSRFVNVETTTPEGIENAKRLKLVESGLADYIVTQHLHAAGELFTEDHQGRMFTIMRDPIERAVSLFHYLAIASWEPTYDPSLATMSIEMWARSEDRIEYNWMTRFLSNNLTGNLTQHDLNIAKEILRKKCLIGFLEAKDESMMRFQKYFDWDMNDSQTRECAERFLDWGWSNKNSHPPIEFDSQAYHLLVKSNEYDLELYEYAELLFEAQAKLF